MSGRPRAYVDPPPRPALAMPQPPAGKSLISLAINESAFGASPRAIAAAKARAEALHRYPDPSSGALRKAIGQSYGLDPDRIICGNGSEELLDVIGRMFAKEGDEIIMAQSGFFQFALVAARQNATLIRAKEHRFKPQIDAFLSVLTPKTKLIFLAVPNNPTGLVIPAEQIVWLHRRLPGDIVLVLDLAYGEYLPKPELNAFMQLAEKAENIVVTRTFSKAFGLAALRVGWLLAPEWMIPGLNMLRGVGSVNALAQATAVAALEDLDFVAEAVAKTEEERAFLAAGLDRLKLNYLPGLGNFLLTEFPADRPVGALTRFAMEEEGIWLRPVGEPGFADWSRLGIGTRDEMEKLLSLLERFLLTGSGKAR